MPSKSADNTGCCKGERRQWRKQRTEAGAAVAECEGLLPRSTMRVPQPDIIEHFGNADAVPQLPERCLSRKAELCGVALGRQAHDVRPHGLYRVKIAFLIYKIIIF